MHHLACVLLPLLLVPLARAGAGVCQDVGAGQEAGQMEDKSMEEASGLAMTRRSEGGGVLKIYLKYLRQYGTQNPTPTLIFHQLSKCCFFYAISTQHGPSIVPTKLIRIALTPL